VDPDQDEFGDFGPTLQALQGEYGFGEIAFGMVAVEKVDHGVRQPCISIVGREAYGERPVFLENFRMQLPQRSDREG
jgi:hypothetical protein